MDVNNVLEIQTISLHAVLKYITQRQFVRTLFKGSSPLGALMKGCSENLQQIYKRTPKPKCDFNKVAQLLLIVANFLTVIFLITCSHWDEFIPALIM